MPEKPYFSAFLILLVFPAFLLSQWIPTRQYTVRNGLAQSQITGIVQDSIGYIWITTQGGVSRFDGEEFLTFTSMEGLPDDVITAVAEDGKGGVWFGTDSGELAFWNGIIMRKVEGPEARDRIPIRAVFVMGQDELLVATDHRLWIRKRGKYELLEKIRIKKIFSDSDGKIWMLGTSGLYYINQNKLVRFSLPEVLRRYRVTAFLPSTSGLWFALNDGRVINLKKNGKLQEFSTSVVNPSVMVPSPEGLWIGGDNGLWFLQKDGTCEHRRLTPSGRVRNISSILVDREGNLWVGTWGDGVFVQTSTFRVFTLETGFPSYTAWSFVEDDRGCIWVGTEDSGVWAWCGSSWKYHLDTSLGLASNQVYSLEWGKDGSLWVGTFRGLCQCKNGKVLKVWTRKNGLPNDIIQDLLISKDGRLWVATSKGLAKYYRGRWKVWGKEEGLTDPLIRAIATDKDMNLWLGTHRHGVVKFDGVNFEEFSKGEGLPDKRIWSIMVDSKNRVWAGTDKGIWVHPVREGKSFVISVNDGLPAPNILFLVEDKRGYIWAGTTRGVARITSKGKVENVFTASDGFSDSEAAQGAALLDSKGMLWFGMAFGITLVDPDSLPFNSEPPPLVLRRILVDGKPVKFFSPLNSVFYSSSPEIRIGHKTSEIRFEFSALSFTAPEKIRYRFMLKGYDPRKSFPTEETFVTYRNLPPGHYEFLLEACNNNEVWVKKPLSVKIFISPPWYKTLWFRVISIFLLLCFVFGGLFLWGYLHKKRREVLEKEVALRTAELEEAKRILEELSLTDHLTGLGNRRMLEEQLPVEMAVVQRDLIEKRKAKEHYYGLGVMMIDLDNFKLINDKMGHDKGDEVLMQIGEFLKATTRDIDLAVRWGGDEFVIMSRLVDTRKLVGNVKRILRNFSAMEMNAIIEFPERLNASIGFVLYPIGTGEFVSTEDWKLILDIADRMLYLAKKKGGARAVGLVWDSAYPADFSEAKLVNRIIRFSEEKIPGIKIIELILDKD